MNHLTLALDWTPNINHIGFFVAQAKGFYNEYGLTVTITDPSKDNYSVTPAKKVELEQADLALCPTESLISFQTKAKPFPLVGIATIFQEDVSAIAVKKGQNINSPKDLDGRKYASYAARYEDAIVKQMIRNAGGKGDLIVGYPSKLGIWETLLNGDFDATWIFLNWEGVQAEAMDTPLTYFKMKDFEVPYSYSPVIAVGKEHFNSNRAVYGHFLEGTKQGFLYAIQQPKEAISILGPHIPEQDRDIDLAKALEISAKHFGNEDNWGKMDNNVVGTFLDWIYANELESKQLVVSDIIHT